MKKMVFAVLLGTALAFGTGVSSQASDWYWVGQDPLGNQFWVDNSKARQEETVHYVWAKINRADGTYVKNYIALSNNNEYTIIHSAEYDQQGQQVSYYSNKDMEWKEVPKGSLMAKLYDLVW
jgi:hypothetical protein